MYIYMLILVASVFLGTEILAVGTPIAQMTIYRVLTLGLIALIGYQLINRSPRLRLQSNSVATLAVGVYIFWWAWAFLSVIWAVDTVAWMQTLFLLTLGILAIIGLYLYIHNFKEWYTVIKVVWIMMSLLIVWGYFEITTNNYILADLSKLDKYGTFSSQPLSRIPITTFENQNDYATMLLAYFPVAITLFQFAKSQWFRILNIVMMVACAYLIYRSQSRLVLLSLLIFFAVYLAQQFKWDFKIKHYKGMLKAGLIVLAGVIILLPLMGGILSSLFYIGGAYDLSGDAVRLNLWRNGLLFLAQTFGFGVGAGNIETWMSELAFLPTEVIVNMHNWWLEILVGYGVLVFMAYVIMYGLLIMRLQTMKKKLSPPYRQINTGFIAFLVAFIFASITSANNMLIEWHWVYFGIIISYIGIMEAHVKQTRFEKTSMNRKRKVGLHHEFGHNYK